MLKRICRSKSSRMRSISMLSAKSLMASSVSPERSVAYSVSASASGLANTTAPSFLIESMLVCVFLHKNHPLADRAQISFAELKPYPCLVLGQGEDSSFYYAEEVLTTAEYDRVIHVSDSPSMRRMLSAMDGYVLCSGLCEDKKQGEFLTIPYLADETNPGGVMEIGYITKNGMVLGELSRAFLALVREALHLPPEDIDAQA